MKVRASVKRVCELQTRPPPGAFVRDLPNAISNARLSLGVLNAAYPRYRYSER